MECIKLGGIIKAQKAQLKDALLLEASLHATLQRSKLASEGVAVCCSVVQWVALGCTGLHWVALGCNTVWLKFSLHAMPCFNHQNHKLKLLLCVALC